MVTARASCGKCRLFFFEAAWINGRQCLIVKCSSCDERTSFDIQKIVDGLGRSPETEAATSMSLSASKEVH